MKTTLTALSLIALLPAGAALADSNDCFAPRNTWQSHEAAMQAARDQGIEVRKLKVDDGCYEIKGRDRDGRKVELKLDPATLAVVETEYDDDDDRGTAGNPAPAGSVMPPQNGLFEGGAAPKVKMN